MHKFRCIAILLIFAFLIGCSFQRNYLIKLDPKVRENISVIRLSINYEKIPEEHKLVMAHRRSSSGTTAWPLGVSRSWSFKRHNNIMKKNLEVVRQALSSNSFPDDSTVRKIFSDLAANTNHISLVAVDSKVWPKEGSKGKDTRMLITIYHKVGVDTSSYAATTYMGIVARLLNSDGTTIYLRRVFSPNWGITTQFLYEEYNSLIEEILRNAAQTFWADITE